MKELIEKGKELIRKHLRIEQDHGRKWKKVHFDSYKDNSYRVELIVFQGSPHKGFMVVDYPREIVTVFDINGGVIRQLKKH